MKLYAENFREGQKYQYIFKTKRVYDLETLRGIHKKNATLLETLLLKNYGKCLVCHPEIEGVYTKKVANEKHRFAARKEA